MEPDRVIANILDGLRARLLAADPDDKEGLAEMNAALVNAMAALPAVDSNLSNPLRLAKTALEKIAANELADAPGAMDAVVAIIGGIYEQTSGRQEKGWEMIAVATSRLEQAIGNCLFAGEMPAAAPTVDAPSNASAAPAPGKPGIAPVHSIVPEDADLDLMHDFTAESLDHIAAAETALLALEVDPSDSEQINTIFRAFHTIKGTSAFLNLAAVQQFAHLAENLLERARQKEIRIVGGYADLALKSCDCLRTIIEPLKNAQPGCPLAIPANYNDLVSELKNPEAAGVSEEVYEEGMRLGEILVGRSQVRPEQVEEALSGQGERPLGEVLLARAEASPEQVAKALRTQAKIIGKGGENTIRVSTDRLDNLINMVGELVIAQSMVRQDAAADTDNPRLLRNVTHVGKIVRELQDLSMSLRMVPLKGTFQKMARLARDVARKAGKDVRFVSEGEDTEIDRSMVEVLNDPLVHMVRNAVDHGLESPDGRRAAGKDSTGTVCLRAFHSAGTVVIELVDDGRGLDKQKIINKAVQRGLIQGGHELSDAEAFDLIFQPGFSTADKVTEVSGRGVGMDVVKRGVESLRGRVDVANKIGQGATFSIRVPLTMAITDAMLVRVGSERYLLPTVSIEQSFRPAASAISTVTGKGEMVLVRGDLLPIFRLSHLFSVRDGQPDPSQALLIIVEGKGGRCALMVDELLGQQQVVVKSLGSTMTRFDGISGAAILGDGRVGLILDISSLMELAEGQVARAA